MAFRTKPDFSAVWASLGDNTKPVDSYITNGWETVKPPRQYFNWIDNRQDSAIAYLYQAGVPEWDAFVDYEGGAGVNSYAQGSNGKIYRCLADNGPNIVSIGAKDPTNALNSAFWTEAFGTKAAVDALAATVSTHTTQIGNGSGVTDAPAWRTALSVDSSAQVDSKIAAVGPKALALFTASTGATVRSTGISSITRNSVGQYTIIFSTTLTNPIISLEMHLGADPGGFALGDGTYYVIGYESLSGTTLVVKVMRSYTDNNGAVAYSMADPAGNIHVVVY